MAPTLTTAPEPVSGHQAATYFPLTGIARRTGCGHLLLPGHDTTGRYAYHCRVCRHRPAIAADAAHRAVVTAIAGLAPHIARTLSLHQLTELLAGLKLDDRGAVIRLTWRATGRWVPRLGSERVNDLHAPS